MRAGEVLVIPSNVVHKAEALEDTLDVDLEALRGRIGSTRPTIICGRNSLWISGCGKIALVTALSQGLGRAVAEELAMEGASLILCAGNEEKLQATCDWIHQRTNSPVMGVAGDLSSAEDVERIVREGNERYGQIEILITNTGGPPLVPFEKLSRDEWDEAGRSLLTSVLDLSRLVLPGMKERSWGRILNITSIAAKQPVENLIISTSLRAAVTGFAKSLADEVAPFGITVNNILPGFTRRNGSNSWRLRRR